jgi:hypothetical protein
MLSRMIYPYGGYGTCPTQYGVPLNYHSHGSLLGTAIGGLLTGDYSGYQYCPNPVWGQAPFPAYGLGFGGYGYGLGGFGGYGLGYGGFGGYGLGYGGFGLGGFGGYGCGGFGFPYGGFGYGVGNVPYGGFWFGSRPNLPAVTGHYNNYRSGAAVVKKAPKLDITSVAEKPLTTPLVQPLHPSSSEAVTGLSSTVEKTSLHSTTPALFRV